MTNITDMRKQVEDLTNNTNAEALHAAVTCIQKAVAAGRCEACLNRGLPGPVQRALEAKGYRLTQVNDQRDGTFTEIQW
jgi:hypothetical protein